MMPMGGDPLFTASVGGPGDTRFGVIGPAGGLVERVVGGIGVVIGALLFIGAAGILTLLLTADPSRTTARESAATPRIDTPSASDYPTLDTGADATIAPSLPAPVEQTVDSVQPVPGIVSPWYRCGHNACTDNAPTVYTDGGLHVHTPNGTVRVKSSCVTGGWCQTVDADWGAGERWCVANGAPVRHHGARCS